MQPCRTLIALSILGKKCSVIGRATLGSALTIPVSLLCSICVQCAIVATRADLRTVAILLDISFSYDLSCILLVEPSIAL